jgi:hypothetical protein
MGNVIRIQWEEVRDWWFLIVLHTRHYTHRHASYGFLNKSRSWKWFCFIICLQDVQSRFGTLDTDLKSVLLLLTIFFFFLFQIIATGFDAIAPRAHEVNWFLGERNLWVFTSYTTAENREKVSDRASIAIYLNGFGLFGDVRARRVSGRTRRRTYVQCTVLMSTIF